MGGRKEGCTLVVMFGLYDCQMGEAVRGYVKD